MDIIRWKVKKTLMVCFVMATFLATGCAGIEPYEPRDHREEGPKKGIFTGSEGAIVITIKGDELEAGNEERNPKTNGDETGSPSGAAAEGAQ